MLPQVDVAVGGPYHLVPNVTIEHEPICLLDRCFVMVNGLNQGRYADATVLGNEIRLKLFCERRFHQQSLLGIR